jgi:hypothetical protein
MHGVDDLGQRQLGLVLADAGLDHPLLLFGRIVVRVLGQVSVAARDLDRLGVGRSIHFLELLDLRLHPIVSGRRHGKFLSHRPVLFSPWRMSRFRSSSVATPDL